jgi:hypothetical protein
MTTLAGPKRSGFIEDAPQQWTVRNTVQIWEGAVVGSWPSTADSTHAGYLDLIEADATIICRGVARKSVLGDTTAANEPAVEVDEKIIPLVFSGGLDTTKRGQLVYAVDTATGTLTAGTPPIGMLMEVVSATKGLVGVGPTFISRAAAAGAAVATTTSSYITDEPSPTAAAVSTTILKAATLITTDPQTILAASLLAGGVAAFAACPRNFTVTGGGTTAHCPTQVVATGLDIDGNALTETLALSSGSGTGVKAFKSFVSFVFTGAVTGDGSCAIGIGNKIGFTKSVKIRAGIPNILSEILDGGSTPVTTTATVASAVTSPPHGTWAPADALDGSDAIAITYEHS